MNWKRKRCIQDLITKGFVDRTNDLKECKKFLKEQDENSVLLISAKQKSGITFFLRKLYEDHLLDFENKKKLDIYLTSKSSGESFSDSLIRNIIKQNQTLQFSLAQKNLFVSFLKFIIIPFLSLISVKNIGFSVVDSLYSSSSNELQPEFTNERKILKFFSKKKKLSIIIVDSAYIMNEIDYELVRKLIKHNVRFVFAMQSEDEIRKSELFLKIFCDDAIKLQVYTFNPPNEEMYEALCKKYNIEYNDDCKLKLSSMCGNIVSIISCFINSAFFNLSDIEKDMLSFTFNAKDILDENLLFQCINLKVERENKINALSKTDFHETISKLIKEKLIVVNSGYLNSSITQDEFATDIIAFKSIICEVLHANINSCNIAQYNFLIQNEHQLQIRIQAILLATKQLISKKENIPQNYVLIIKDNLLNIENTSIKEKCEIILTIYYLKQFDYDVALQVLNDSTKKSRVLQKLYAYTLNRTQNLDLAEKELKKLIDTSNDIDELAVLCSILAITFIHQNRVNLALNMYNSKDNNKWNFANFKASSKRTYFLRSIAYYINDEQEAEFCFKQICKLGKINDNNYFAFTTKNNFFARKLASRNEISEDFFAELENLSNEIPYYELRLFYNNVGIYYLQNNKEKSEKAFRNVSYLTKTKNDLPYFFSKINCAIMYAYYNEFPQSQNIFDEIEDAIKVAKLSKIQSSYYLALLLFNYMQGKDLSTHIDNVKKHPIKKLNFDSDSYISKIESLCEKNIKYTPEIFPSLFVKNVTFYWYIDPLDLLSRDEILSL